MAHQFDTGLVRPQRTVVQRAVVDILSPLLRSNGGYLLALVTFGGVARSYTDEDGIASLVDHLKSSPSVGVALGTRTFGTTGIGRGQAKSDLDLILYFMSQHQRGRQIGRQESDVVAQADNQADPGLHVIMEHALELVIGQYPGATTSIKQIVPVREEELATLQHVTIWMQTYTVILATTTPFSGRGDSGGGVAWRTAPQLLESIGWRVTTSVDETSRPAAATISTSVDADTDI